MPAPSVLITRSDVAPCIFSELRPTVKLFVPNVPSASIIFTWFPIEGEEGKVIVKSVPDVSQKRLSPSDAV